MIRTITLAILLASCVLPANADKADVDKALAEWLDCSLNAIIWIDDGKSDAATIAQGVQSRCRFKREAWLAEIINLMFANDPKAGAKWADDMRAREFQRIIADVLEYRDQVRQR